MNTFIYFYGVIILQSVLNTVTIDPKHFKSFFLLFVREKKLLIWHCRQQINSDHKVNLNYLNYGRKLYNKQKY